MKRITLSRNGQTLPREQEASDLKIGTFRLGEHVLLGITGDCCYAKKDRLEYEVAEITPSDRYGGTRETYVFRRCRRRIGGKGGAE